MGIGRGNDRRSSAERRRTLRVIEEALALRNGVYRALLRGCSARCDKNARAKIAAPSRRQCSANFLQSGRSPPCVIPASMEEHHGASSTALAAISEDTRCRSAARSFPAHPRKASLLRDRSEEHTSELQSLMRISYAVFCLKKKKTQKPTSR